MSKKEYHLYLVKETTFKLLTEAEAAHLALMKEVDMWNVSEELGMEPELLEDTTSSNVDS